MVRQYHYKASVISLAFARHLRRVSRMVSLPGSRADSFLMIENNQRASGLLVGMLPSAGEDWQEELLWGPLHC
jgi:hypothetical protein